MEWPGSFHTHTSAKPGCLTVMHVLPSSLLWTTSPHPLPKQVTPQTKFQSCFARVFLPCVHAFHRGIPRAPKRSAPKPLLTADPTSDPPPQFKPPSPEWYVLGGSRENKEFNACLGAFGCRAHSSNPFRLRRIARQVFLRQKNLLCFVPGVQHLCCCFGQ